MSRQIFGQWAAGVDDKTLGRALAAIGVQVSVLESGHSNAGWFLGRAVFQVRDSPVVRPASFWADRWPELTRMGEATVSLRLIDELSLDLSIIDLPWLTRLLSSVAGVTSVTIERWNDQFPSKRTWGWPLQVGFLSDAQSQALSRSMSNLHWQRFVQFVNAHDAVKQIDLLINPGTLSEALAAVTRGSWLPEVHTVLALGGIGRTRGVSHMLEALRVEADAAASGVLEVPTDEASEWLDSVLFELSHDQPLDVALFSPLREPPLLCGARGAWSSACVSQAARHLARRFARAAPEETIAAAPSRMLQNLGLPETARMVDLAHALEERAKELPFDHEGDTATDVADLVKAMPRLTRRSDGRFVQARVLADGKAVDGALEPGILHTLEVRIAFPAPEWTTAPAPFPLERLPENPEGHLLTVVFNAQSLFEEPATASLWLPAYDDSETCVFHFRPPEGAKVIQGRITVLYRNRILQTLRVTAPVGRSTDEHPAISLRLESVSRANLTDVGGTPGFDASILLNDVAGERGMATFAEGRAAYISMGSVDALLNDIRAELERVTRAPEKYETLETEQSRALLVTLARAGASFYRTLGKLPRMSGVLSAVNPNGGRLQIVTLHLDEIVPLEFAYDKVFPDTDAVLCAGFAGQCDGKCAQHAKVVCAKGFWGLRHVIERRHYDPIVAEELQDKGAAYKISPEASDARVPFPPLKSVLFGKANRAEAFDPEGFNSIVQELAGSLQAQNIGFESVDTWKGWVDSVAASTPGLLLLVPHTEPQMGAAVLEIGHNEHLAAVQIAQDHVSTPPPCPPQPGPIVVLLGCRTAMDDVPFSSFVGAFADARASVVIATIGTVRGRHMAPVAHAAVQILLERSHGTRSTIGEVVRDLRRMLLSKNLIVGLSLISFGEVDWQVGGHA